MFAKLSVSYNYIQQYGCNYDHADYNSLDTNLCTDHVQTIFQSLPDSCTCEKAVKDLQIKTPNVEIDSGNLSGGNQQKVVVGKWLARDSRVVIFDEPTRGIDVGAKVEIYNLMNELKKQGIAVMFVSSEMPEVMGIADRIIVMCDGRITGEVSAREATQDEILTMATSFENKSIKETEGGSKNE